MDLPAKGMAGGEGFVFKTPVPKLGRHFFFVQRKENRLRLNKGSVISCVWN